MKEDWKECKLSEIMTLIGGGTPKTSNPDYWNGDIPWISVKDFNGERRYVIDTEKKITKLGLENSSTKLLSKGDIIISARGTVGELAIIPSDMAFNQSCYGLRAKEYVDSTFLYYLLKQSVSVLQHNTHGSVFDTITRDTFDGITINLPPLATQQKIAAILSSLDDKIELNNKINTNLEQQAQALFKNWFVDGSEKSHTIGDYIVPKRGKNLLSKDAIPGEVPVVAGGLEPATYHNTANTKAPVLTISASGANAGFVNLWNIPVWSSDSSYIDSEMTNDVYFWYILLKLRQKEIFDSQTGSAQPHIYPQHISVLPIPELDMTKVSEFAKTVKPLFGKIGENQQENRTLTTIRDTLLPKLMNGEIEVDEAMV